MINYVWNGKATIVLLTVGLIKKAYWIMSEYSPKTKSSGGTVKVKIVETEHKTTIKLYYYIKIKLYYHSKNLIS